jgi:hypothetical protein
LFNKGNCWFISALSLIAQEDKLIRGDFIPNKDNIKEISDEEAQQMRTGLYPPMFHFLAPFGIYVFRFFKNFKWRWVVIDDRLCCKENAEIVYGQCTSPCELWVPLIEKAYAKLHNCY